MEEALSDTELKEKVQVLLDSTINPAVQMHGGFIQLEKVEEGVVYIQMGGGCQGCGSADVTLRAGVEQLLREELPEITEIRDITDHASGANPYYSAAK